MAENNPWEVVSETPVAPNTPSSAPPNAAPASSSNDWQVVSEAPMPQQGSSTNYVPADNEQTPAGAAAALSQRQAQHPVLTAVGQGAEAALGDVWDAVKGTPAAIAQSLPPVGAYESIKQTIPVIQAYEKARSAGKGILDSLSEAQEVAKQHNAAQQALKERIDEFKKNPGPQAVRAVMDAATLAASIYDGGSLNPANIEVPGVPAGVHSEFVPGEGLRPTPLGERVGLVKQVMKGENVAQPGAQAAVRSGVQASAESAGTTDAVSKLENRPLLKGNTTVVDDHLNALQKNEAAAYKQMDETAGFDVKAEKAQLANDKYKLAQLGNTDPDITQRGNLIESINDSTDRIAEAEVKMKAAGIDPNAADAIHKQRMAGTEFKKALMQSTSPDGASVNVDGLLNASKKMRFSKYGDRLEQFFGSPEAADKYMQQLQDMQKLGAHAVKMQEMAKTVAKYVVLPAIGGGIVGEVVRHAL